MYSFDPLIRIIYSDYFKSSTSSLPTTVSIVKQYTVLLVVSKILYLVIGFLGCMYVRGGVIVCVLLITVIYFVCLVSISAKIDIIITTFASRKICTAGSVQLVQFS